MTQPFKWLFVSTCLLLGLVITEVNSECNRCTLTVMCWMTGGLRRDEGCSGPSWLVTCCLPQVTRSDGDSLPRQEARLPSLPQQLVSSSSLQGSSTSSLPQQLHYGGIRSSSGTGSFQLSNTLEEIANLGMNEWKSAWPSQNRFFLKVKPAGHVTTVPYNEHAVADPQQSSFQQILTQQQIYQHKQQLQQQQQQRTHQQQPFIAFNTINPVLRNKQAVCGLQPLRPKLQKRIIGGDQASFGEFPWQVHIRIAGFQCGGVLLNHHYIATAAHCVHRAKLSQIVIYLGEYDTKDLDKSETLPKETLSVIERKIHPQFKYMLTQPDRYDVALLKLSRPVAFRDNILPICLPPQGKDYEGALAVVAGWGKTDTSFGKTGTNLLQKVYVPIINNHICYAWHEMKDIILELHDEMFCAGHEQGKMDACLGDSGGPLVVNDAGRWTLVGITSAGFGCAVDHQPGIYHKVSKTVPWILANIID